MGQPGKTLEVAFQFPAAENADCSHLQAFALPNPSAFSFSLCCVAFLPSSMVPSVTANTATHPTAANKIGYSTEGGKTSAQSQQQNSQVAVWLLI
jgi:hypothetical protein